MSTLAETAPAFIDIAHRIVWATVATVGPDNRPRTRVLHPIWQWDGTDLLGWVATGPTPVKTAHLAHVPHVSITYWDHQHDIASVEARATFHDDLETRRMVWDLFVDAPPPVGYDPAMIPNWDAPESDTFTALRLEPWRLRVFPGTVLFGQGGDVLTWSS